MSGGALVTGAAGFAGGHLVDRLAAAGVPVTGWYRPGGSGPRPVAGATWEAVDLFDAEAIDRALDRVTPSVVYHCAGAPHVGSSWRQTRETFEGNVLSSHRLLEGLRRRHSAARVVLTSSAMVYAASSAPLHEDSAVGPASPYGVSKLAQEMIAREDAGTQQVIIARAFNHFGPRQSPGFVTSDFARRVADIEAGRIAPEIAVGNLEARRDLTDVRDTVDAYRQLAAHGRPGRIYNVCSGRAVMIGDLLEMLLGRARTPIVVRVDPARFRPVDQPLVLGDNTRIRSEAGWTPQIPLEQTIDDTLDYWRARAAVGS